MPQLLTDTDSLRLVPIVATCSVTHVTHCTRQLQCIFTQVAEDLKSLTENQQEIDGVLNGRRQGLSREWIGVQQGLSRELIGN